ncbi:MAG: hypothetical protein OXP68_12390 [Anaerolineaceae bacterium]|nr:hypothetical protein [Anaerolineaceae bacterium]MDE0329078.1 hypothetical protein [Anaerolineaceae bacterium]MDE0608964.1 hypothetical protein [Anaerolineaceae bacterium]
MKVRPATLDDTAAISELHCAQIPVWQRLDESGRVQDVEREALSIYERWQHGGPWMSVETGALHLSHLLHGAGTPLVAEDEGVVVASAVLYEGHEPEPYGRHLSMEHPTVLPDLDGKQILNTMLAAAREQMKEHGVSRLLLPLVLPELQEEYASRGFSLRARIIRVSLPARVGQGFYRSSDWIDPAPRKIAGWSMPIGRVGSARQQWETLWPETWGALGELRRQRIHRLQFDASGHEALVCCRQQLYAERNAEIFCWSPRPLTRQLLTALRDWAHRTGYRTLILNVEEAIVPTFGPEAEADGFSLAVYGLDLDEGS